MAVSAFKPSASVLPKLNERPIGTTAVGTQSFVAVARPSTGSRVHAKFPCQLNGKKLKLSTMPAKIALKLFQGARASDGGGGMRQSQPGDAVPGDSKLQEELVGVLRREIAKVQWATVYDEEADKLREIAAEGLKELDKKFQNIMMNTFNEVDAEGERALRLLDANSAQLRKSLKESKALAEASAKESELLQQSISESLNQHLFYKNYHKSLMPQKEGDGSLASNSTARTPAQAQQLQQELQAIRDITNDSFASGYRQLLYGALSIVMTSAIWSTTTAFFSGGPIRWTKVAIYVGILACILMQFWFESSQPSPAAGANDAGAEAEAKAQKSGDEM